MEELLTTNANFQNSPMHMQNNRTKCLHKLKEPVFKIKDLVYERISEISQLSVEFTFSLCAL